jgi:hypothetical protein
MMADRKGMGRRAFLRGVGGAVVTLPLLEYTHGHVWAQGGAAKRFLTVFSHGGTISNQDRDGKHDGTGSHHGEDWWRPADPGSQLVLGPIHEPLGGLEDKLLVLQSIDNRAAVEQAEYDAGGHGLSNVTCLTAADAESAGEDSRVPLGPSIDFVLANRLMERDPVRFNRIHLMISGHQYGTPYARAARERVSGETNPQVAFDRIFDGISTDSEPDPALVRRRMKRRSVLDGVLEGYRRFRSTVSAADAHRIEAHFEHLRALERELEQTELTPACVPPDGTSAGDGADADVIGPLHVRIILHALRCGLTHVANLEIADILTPWTDAGIRMDSAFDIGHSLGHYAREVGPEGANAGQLDDWLAEMRDNRRWRIGLLRQLLEGLEDPDFMEGDRTMLDNSLVLYTSEFSDPAGHHARNQPVLLAGSAGGYFRTGRNIDYNAAAASTPDTLEYDTDKSTHNLFTSILQAFGGSDGHFGSDHAAHRGPLPDLT